MLRPQFCVLGPEIESAYNQPCFFHADSISGPKTQNCGLGIFFTALSQLIFFFKFVLTLSAHNYASNTPNLKNLNFARIFARISLVFLLQMRPYFARIFTKMSPYEELVTLVPVFLQK